MRITVVGAGTMGRHHVRVLRELGHTVRVADPSPAARELDPGAVARLRDALDADAAIIAAPTTLHEELAIEALEAGLHVLVEKPLAADVAAAARIDAAARRAGRVLAVGHIERHNPVVAYAKQALNDGRHGAAIAVSARRVSNFPGRIRDVGCILDIGIHDIDVVCHLLGTPRRVVAMGGTRTPGLAVEDHAAILLDHGHATSVVEVNWLTPRKVRTLSLTCDQAYVELDYIQQSVHVSTSHLAHGRVVTEADAVPIAREEPLRRELVDFLAATQGGTPLVGAADAIRALDVATQATAQVNADR